MSGYRSLNEELAVYTVRWGIDFGGMYLYRHQYALTHIHIATALSEGYPGM